MLSIYFYVMELYLYKSILVLKLLARYFLLFGPFWLLGIVFGCLVSHFISFKLLSGSNLLKGWLGIGAGSAIGVISPIGLYGAIPLSLALSRAGVPAPPIFAFLAATPLINPNLFIYTLGVLGPRMALARLVSAVTIGVIAGGMVKIMTVASAMPKMLELGSAGGQQGAKGMERFGDGDRSFAGFFKKVWHFLRFSAPYFVIATVIASWIEVFIPKTWINQLLGANNPFSVLAAAALSIPLYICGGNTIPFIKSLMTSGMSDGAALSYFIAGPATKISNLAALASILGTRGVAVFVALSVGLAVIFGYIYNML